MKIYYINSLIKIIDNFNVEAGLPIFFKLGSGTTLAHFNKMSYIFNLQFGMAFETFVHSSPWRGSA